MVLVFSQFHKLDCIEGKDRLGLIISFFLNDDEKYFTDLCQHEQVKAKSGEEVF